METVGVPSIEHKDRGAGGLPGGVDACTAGDHDGAPVRGACRGSGGSSGARSEAPDRRPSALAAGQRQKSALVAGLACAVVDPAGPLNGARREVVCRGRKSFEQARIIFEDVLSFLGERYDLDDRAVWRKANTANRALLEHKATGARVRCVGSDPATSHGLRPYLALMDEPAQHEPSTRDRLLAAIRTGLGKMPGSRLIALGTRPADDTHWFARMLAGEGAAYTPGARGAEGRPAIPRQDLEGGEPIHGPFAKPPGADSSKRRRRRATAPNCWPLSKRCG